MIKEYNGSEDIFLNICEYSMVADSVEDALAFVLRGQQREVYRHSIYRFVIPGIVGLPNDDMFTYYRNERNAIVGSVAMIERINAVVIINTDSRKTKASK